MHLGGKCQISWANDDLEIFLKVRALCAMNLSGTRGPWQIGLSGGSKFFLLGGGVCFFHFSISNSECGTAHLSLLWSVVYSCCSRCAAFVSIIHVNDLLDDVKIYFLESNFSSMYSECGTTQLSLLIFVLYYWCSEYVAFVKFIHLNDLFDYVTFLFSTN